MSSLRFSKMHGLGNDFMLVNAINQTVALTTQTIQSWANRHTGIGFDQLLIAEPSEMPGVVCRYRIYNADGSEAEQCGNGARCFAQFLIREGITDKTTFSVEAAHTVMQLQILSDDLVRVSMGAPSFREVQVTVPAPYTVLSMGNPHIVLRVPDVNAFEVGRIGAMLQNDPAFPGGVNVGFMQTLHADQIRLRVYERGVGETQACGSGACAAVVAGIHAGNLNDSAHVEMPGGQMQVSWQGDQEPVWLTGPVAWVYDGICRL